MNGPEESELPEGTIDAIRSAIHDEFDKVLPHVLDAVRRNYAFDEINERLREAERRIEARRERPLVIGVHRLLDRLRHLDFDKGIKQALEADFRRVLADVGYAETGRVGEPYDPEHHDAIGGHAVNGSARVTAVHTHGLVSFGDVVVRAKVEISPERSNTSAE